MQQHKLFNVFFFIGFRHVLVHRGHGRLDTGGESEMKIMHEVLSSFRALFVLDNCRCSPDIALTSNIQKKCEKILTVFL